ncbi:MAG: TetR/AcrR family transcriptional regulator, partial [Rhodospirillaceae bacterium]|nr:TetR/AcrR family transcriptional regulator [Rhodospirillaceae bacterium]
MTGLRDRQKQARREAIYRAAAKLFAEKGYGATTVDDIAGEAGVSVPTFYAYVATKADLIIVIYAHDRALIDLEKQAIINDPGDDPVEAIIAMMLTELKSGEEFLGHKVWREIVVTTIRGRGDFHEGLDRLNKRAFDDPVERLLRVLVRRGQIAPDADIEDAVAVLSDLVMAVFHQQLGQIG